MSKMPWHFSSMALARRLRPLRANSIVRSLLIVSNASSEPVRLFLALVLGLLAREGPSTPYDLERHVAATLGNFWSFPHTLLYSEPPRLVALGMVPLRQSEMEVTCNVRER